MPLEEITLTLFAACNSIRAVAPLAALGVGTSFSLQGLWAAPWLADVEGLDRPAVVAHLTFMAVALAASALLLGAAAERLRRAGIPTELFLGGTLVLSMAAQLALLLGLPVPSYVLFAVIAAAGAATVLSFAALAQSVADADPDDVFDFLGIGAALRLRQTRQHRGVPRTPNQALSGEVTGTPYGSQTLRALRV